MAKKKVYFKKELTSYVEYLRLHGKRESTIGSYEESTRKLLNRFYSHGIRSLAEIKVVDVYAAFETSANKGGFRIAANSFLKYLFKKNLNDVDLSLIIPKVPRPKPVPSIYSKSETEKLISSIDTSVMIGKRDYAVILLALRLGMRASDILNLKVSDINYDGKTIEFVQIKTYVPHRLALLPEVEDALSAYLSCRTNPQGNEHVFLSTVAPFKPLSKAAVRTVVSKYIEKAGIDVGYRKRGGHALRSTFASELVAENVPYDVIRKILGHESQESTKHYVKFDFEMLRKCALEAPMPIGRLAEILCVTTGGGV